MAYTKITEKAIKVYSVEEKLRMRYIGQARWGWWTAKVAEGIKESQSFAEYAINVKNRLFDELMLVDWSIEMPGTDWEHLTVDFMAEHLTWLAIDKAMEKATAVDCYATTYTIGKQMLEEMVLMPWVNFDAHMAEILREIIGDIRCLEQV